MKTHTLIFVFCLCGKGNLSRESFFGFIKPSSDSTPCTFDASRSSCSLCAPTMRCPTLSIFTACQPSQGTTSTWIRC